MDYRDPAESLRIRRERITSDLAEARQAAERALELARRVTELERNLTETDQLLEGGVQRRPPSLLDAVKIASPCTAKWGDMVGDERVRFCGHCRKDVYDLSAMRRDEAEALLAERTGGMCARLYRRPDGTVKTADCPTGARRRRLAIAGVVGGGVLVAAALRPVPVIQGKVVAQPIRMGALAMPVAEPDVERPTLPPAPTVRPPSPPQPAATPRTNATR